MSNSSFGADGDNDNDDDGDRLRGCVPMLVKDRREDGLRGIDAIATPYWYIDRRQRSAWAQEVDLWPFKETFLDT